MKPTERADVLIEAIEVLINQILYLRDAYPGQIFKKRRIFNCPVFQSIFPPLNSYLYNVLRSAKDLLTRDNNLKSVDLVFYTGELEMEIFERHTFDLFDLAKSQGRAEDEFLLQFEEELRKSLYEMPERMKLLKKLPSDTKMMIRLHTTQVGHVLLSNDVNFQDFPWIQSDLETVPVDTNIEKRCYLLPVTSVYDLGLNLTTETLRT